MHELDIYKERIRDNICFIIEDVVGKTTIFASEIQKKKKNVGKWKRGESIPSVLQLIKIADWYGVTLDDMVRKDLKHFSTDMSHKLTTDYISGVSEMIRNALTGDEYVWSVLLKESPALKKEIDKRIEDQIRCRSDLELAEKLEEEGNLDDAWPLYEGCARNYHEIKGVWGAIRCIRKKQDIEGEGMKKHNSMIEAGPVKIRKQHGIHLSVSDGMGRTGLFQKQMPVDLSVAADNFFQGQNLKAPKE